MTKFTYSLRANFLRDKIYINLHLPDEIKNESTQLSKLMRLTKSVDPSSVRKGEVAVYKNTGKQSEQHAYF